MFCRGIPARSCAELPRPTVSLVHATISYQQALLFDTVLLFLSWASDLFNRRRMMLNFVLHNELSKYPDFHRYMRPMLRTADLVRGWDGKILPASSSPSLVTQENDYRKRVSPRNTMSAQVLPLLTPSSSSTGRQAS